MPRSREEERRRQETKNGGRFVSLALGDERRWFTVMSDTIDAYKILRPMRLMPGERRYRHRYVMLISRRGRSRDETKAINSW